MHAGTAQIAIDQERFVALLRVRHCEVGGYGRFAFGGRCAGDHHGAQAAVEIGQQNRIAEGANGFIRSRRRAPSLGLASSSALPFAARPSFTPGSEPTTCVFRVRTTCSGSRTVRSSTSAP